MTQLADHGTLAIPEPSVAHPPTSLPDCDQALAELRGSAQPWYAERPGDLAPLLERLTASLMEHAKDWVAAACAAKQIPDGSPLVGEEWSSIAVTARYLRLLGAAMRDLAAGQPPMAPSPPHSVAGNRIAVPAFPVDVFDKAAMSGFTVEVWLKRGVSVAQANERQAAAWSGGGRPGISLVLGAGNVASIPIVDALDRLFIARHPVMLKMNPVNDYLGPIFEQAFGELVAAACSGSCTAGPTSASTSSTTTASTTSTSPGRTRPSRRSCSVAVPRAPDARRLASPSSTSR